MTDAPTPDDELLSAELDGELTADESARLHARLAGDPALANRRDELAAAAGLIAAPVPSLRAADREGMLEAALAASATAENVTDLAAARSQNRWRTALITAAAGVVAIAIAVPALNSIRSEDDVTADSAETAATAGDSGDEGTGFEESELAPSALDSADSDDADFEGGDDAAAAADGTGNSLAEAEDAGDAAGGAEGGSFEAGPSEAALPFGSFDLIDDDLGEFEDPETLADSIADSLPFAAAEADADAPETSTTVPGLVTPGLDDEVRTRFGCTDIGDTADSILDSIFDAAVLEAQPLAIDVGSATIAGAPVGVVVVAFADGTGQLFLVEAETCAIEDPVTLG